MKVELKADADKIAKALAEDFYATSIHDQGDPENREWGVDGYLEDVIDAVLKHVKVKVDGYTALAVVK